MNTHTCTTETSFTAAGQVWGRLHAEREEICGALVTDRLDATPESKVHETDANEESSRDVEFKRRELLQARLRQLDDALDRVISGAYGRCSECNSSIEQNRLEADPAVTFCIACQQYCECDHHFRTL